MRRELLGSDRARRGYWWLWVLGTAMLASGPGSTAHSQDNCMVRINRHNQVPGTGVGSPGQRAHHAMAYDSDRGVTVFFGGEIGKTGSEKYFNDTWEYDGTLWRKINVPDPIPVARSFHAMAYDPVRKCVRMYGRFGGGDYGFDDTWEYTGDGMNGSWKQVAGNASDEGFVGTALVWAEGMGIMARLRGESNPFQGGFQEVGSTALWTGTNW
jgi:hypothetical protein